MTPTRRPGRRVGVAAAQLVARPVADAEAALGDAVAAIESAAQAGAELVVLPECTWPGYILGSDWREVTGDLAGYPHARAALAGAARAAEVVVVVGLARPHGAAALNEALVIDIDGRVAGSVAKRFLWDFDRRWFVAGRDSPVIKTSLGRLGVLVCADGRMPEVARLLAVAGAEVLIDPTAWVTAGADPATWTNPQYEHMLRTRARENGLWAVAANKTGVERDAVAYCGRSCVVDPDGRVVAEAAPDSPGVATARVALGSAAFPVPRRPDLYGTLTRPTPGLPVIAVLDQPLTGADAAVRVALDALSRHLGPGDARLLDDCGVALLVSPRSGGPDAGTALRADGAEHATATVDGRTVAVWSRTHGAAAPGDRIGPVTPLGGLRVGVLLGSDALAPEPARCLMLDGAEVLVWFPGQPPAAGVAATRAAENRVPVLVVPPVGAAPAVVLDADGQALATAAGGRGLVLGHVDRGAARRKEMAPGTDVVRGRQPECYGALVTPTGHDTALDPPV